jgi:hypothetical protein
VKPSPWAGVWATARGAQHDRRGLPNQDAVTTVALTTPLPATVAVVADGHGGNRYVRSDVGSRFAVTVACDAVAEWLPRLAAVPVRTLAQEAHTGLVPTIVERWRARVLGDHAANPFTPAERERAGVPLDEDPIVAYGATLLVAVATDEWVLLVQLGDGDVIVSSADGRTWTPVPGDDRLAGGQTTSLCLSSAVSDARVAVVTAAERADLVVVSSDGYGNSFADRDWRDSVAADLHRHVRGKGIAAVGSDLPAWLADSARVGGDDVSVAVLARTLPAAAPGGRRRLPALLAVGAAALLIGGVSGWALRSTPAATAPNVAAPPPTIPVTTVATTSTIPPSTTTSTTAAPAVAKGQLGWIWGVDGALVIFRLDNSDVPIRWSGALTDPVAPAQAVTLANGARFELVNDGKTLRARSDLAVRDYQLTIEGGAVAAAGGRVWVLSKDATQLVAIDPTASAVPAPVPVTSTAAAPGEAEDG